MNPRSFLIVAILLVASALSGPALALDEADPVIAKFLALSQNASICARLNYRIDSAFPASIEIIRITRNRTLARRTLGEIALERNDPKLAVVTVIIWAADAKGRNVMLSITEVDGKLRIIDGETKKSAWADTLEFMGRVKMAE